MTYEQTLFIDREWQAGDAGSIPVINPATEETVVPISSATTAQVNAALQSSHAAQRDWAKLSPVERGRYLRDIAKVLLENKDALARLCVQEVGKPISQAAEEVDNASAYCVYTAEWDRRIEGEILPSDRAGESIHLMRTPLGVVSAITPWNYPIELYFRKVAPALLTGNTVVLKPSEVTPLTSIEITRLIHEQTDLPAGVLNLVTGGAATGNAMVTSPLTAMVSMTGHRDTGKKIMAAAAANLTRVSLELGGSAPAIVWQDADLDIAVAAIIAARHTNAGQVCTCAERIYVHDQIFSEFVDRYVAAAQALKIGDPRENPDMGPLINAAQFKKVEAAVAKAKSDGAKLVTGGAKPSGEKYKRGFWFAPTIFTEVTPDMDIMREETFGPVSPIMSVSSLDDALSYANDSRYGLSAYIFSTDYKVIMRAAHEFEFGEIYVNRTMGEALQAHHIGHKESGIGGEDGKYGVLKYTQLRTVYHRYA